MNEMLDKGNKPAKVITVMISATPPNAKRALMISCRGEKNWRRLSGEDPAKLSFCLTVRVSARRRRIQLSRPTIRHNPELAPGSRRSERLR